MTRVLQRTCFSSTWILRVSSGSGGFSVAVNVVPVSAPKYGIMQQVPTRVLAAWQHAFDMHRERVAGFGALDHDRAVLRIDERHAQPFGRLVAFGADGAFERVAGFDADAVAGATVSTGSE